MEQSPPNPPQQDSSNPCMPCKKTLRQPTPGLSVTQCSEDLFHGKPKNIPFLISTFDSSELNLPPFVEPSQHNEPPIPGLNQSSKSHEDTSTCEPEPEVALTQSMKDPFACPATPCSIIIIDDIPVGSTTPLPWFLPQRSLPYPLAPTSPQSHDEAWQEFTDLRPTLMIP
ncbi:hypothetical protein O181_110093 [Austropuccinia psidii MF-1]|uniref:Uncharacterized protein n=1 Tax=Austropuccinia psidii MF-1 TaxID=1389203 RepID=A0A9Q3PQG1_9BASI|nr:hypothetical protein [Austropuccinia psidii MF-1]